MNADGSGKTRITAAAPRFTDGRPSWSPNGRYLAFVKTQAGRAFGDLDQVRHGRAPVRHVFFDRPDQSAPHVTRIQALPGTAVAWQWARNAGGDGFGSFLLLEEPPPSAPGIPVPLPDRAWLRPPGPVHRHGFASAEFDHSGPTVQVFTDPDWFPNRPDFATQVLTTVENCPATPCTHTGLMLTITLGIPPSARRV